MKVKEIRELSTKEINEHIVSAKEELFNLRFQQATGALEKPSRIKDLRHEIMGCYIEGEDKEDT